MRSSNARTVWLTADGVTRSSAAAAVKLLVQQFEVHGKQVHDCNIVATMLAHGVRHLATRNAADFKRYESLISRPRRP
jgi:hypothetical protein